MEGTLSTVMFIHIREQSVESKVLIQVGNALYLAHDVFFILSSVLSTSSPFFSFTTNAFEKNPNKPKNLLLQSLLI